MTETYCQVCDLVTVRAILISYIDFLFLLREDLSGLGPTERK